MVKQGGTSWNTNPGTPKGIKTRYKCGVCGRQYKQEWSKDNHEKLCKQKNKVKE